MGGGRHDEWIGIFKRLTLSVVRRRNGSGESGNNKTKSKIWVQVVRAGGRQQGWGK